jgi:hypothetical protein
MIYLEYVLKQGLYVQVLKKMPSGRGVNPPPPLDLVPKLSKE